MNTKPIIHNTITSKSVTTEQHDLGAQDLTDAQNLVTSDPWLRFFVRRINKKIQDYKNTLAILKSDNISDFKSIQSKIDELEQIKKIPDQTIVSLTNSKQGKNR